YIKAGQIDSAVYELREATRLVPGSQVFRSNLADALLLSNQPKEAEREAREAIRLDWNRPQAHYLLGLSLIFQKIRVEEAVEHLKIAAASMPAASEALAHALHDSGIAADSQVSRP